MKLVLYKDIIHRNNFDAIQRMCAATNIEFEFTGSLDRLRKNDYDILYSFVDYIDPSILPPNVKILFGPHAFVFPSYSSAFVGSADERLTNRAIYNCLCNWVNTLYFEHVNSFKMPVVPFPFAVDTKRFAPQTSSESKDLDCLIYVKHRSNTDRAKLNEIIKTFDLKCVEIVYGSYNEDQYISLLNRSKFMIVLDAHESQGFALEEAMSCNVPLLVIDATSMYDEYPDGNHQQYAKYKPLQLKATSVPYWSDECGLKATLDDLPEKIQAMKDTWQTFRPRDYIVRELSEVPCMKRILDYFKLPMP